MPPAEHRQGGTLSVCMIVRNEEANLKACLESISTCADEIIVVDTGSTDNTVPIAEQAGARVILSDWRNDFSYSRNISLSHATCGWILWLDADDRLPPETVNALNRIKLEAPVAAISLKIRNIGTGPSGEEWLQLRLVPNHPDIRFERKVHEQLMPSVLRAGYDVISLADVVVLHTGYADDGTRRLKSLRNRQLMAGELERFSNDPAFLAAYGDSFAITGEWENAIDLYRRVLSLPDCQVRQPDIFEYMPVVIAICYRNQGNSAEALTWLNRALSIRADKIEAHFLAAEIAWDTGIEKAALEHYEKSADAPERLLSTHTDFIALKAKANMRAGSLLLKQGRTDDAKKRFMTVYNGAVPFSDVPASLGEAAFISGDLTDAVRWFKESMERYPGQDPRPYRYLPLISHKLGDVESALRICRNGMELFPSDKELEELLHVLTRS